MADTTLIEWTATRLPDGTLLPGYTFNPWTGCTKVSPGCDHCYAEGWAKRSGHVQWGPHGARRRTSAANWAKPVKWNAEAEATGIRRKVFCASLADVFDNHGSILPEWRADLWRLILATPYLDWLLLTKRPQNIAKFLPVAAGLDVWRDGWQNVWLGTTAENQTEAARRLPHLLAVPAAVRFVSAEPLLGQISFDDICDGHKFFDALRGNWWHDSEPPYIERDKPRLDWVIIGGESGPGARPMADEWAQDIIHQCKAAGVAVFMKQMGGVRKPFRPIPDSLNVREWPNA